MWPWEHAAIGYLLYSVGLRLLERDTPSAGETVSIVVMAVLPDLLDKPLSWSLQLTPSGYGFLHSAFVAIPVGLTILLFAFRTDRARLGIASIVGYWSHLVADVLSPIRSGGQPIVGRVLWPIVDSAPYTVDYGLGRGLVYLGDFGQTILTMAPHEIVVFYLAMPAVTFVLWLLDGKPGAAIPGHILASVRTRFE